MDKLDDDIWKRMSQTGDYVVIGKGGWFWANRNVSGCLISTLSSDEVQSILRLVSFGIIKKRTKRIYNDYDSY